MSGLKRYWRVALGGIVIAALIIAPMYLNRYGLFILSQWAVMTIAAMGLNLTLGYAGLCLASHDQVPPCSTLASRSRFTRRNGITGRSREHRFAPRDTRRPRDTALIT